MRPGVGEGALGGGLAVLDAMHVVLDGSELGPFRRQGERWDVQVRPGTWSLLITGGGKVVAQGTLVASPGAVVTVEFGADGALRAEPAGALLGR